MRLSLSLSVAVAATAFGIATLPSPAHAAWAAMEEVPAGTGELRLAKPRAAARGQGEASATEEAVAYGFPLKHTDVDVRIDGLMASVVVRQTFENPYDTALDAVYVFPLGDEAAVHGYSFDVAGHHVVGVIQRAEEARRTHEKARQEGKTSALLEQDKPNIFTQEIANLPPRERIVVELRYVELVDVDRAESSFVFPLVVGPRYLPAGGGNDPRAIGAAPAGAGPVDGARRTLGYLPPSTRPASDVSLRVLVDAGLPVVGFACVSHECSARAHGDTGLALELADQDVVPNRDFELRYTTAGPETRVALLTDATDGEGTFSLVVQPPAPRLDDDARSAREVVIVIDTSGSMSGPPLEQAKTIGSVLLRALGPEDTFHIVTFASGVRTFSPAPRPARPADVEEGLTWLRALRSGGGTEMMKGAAAALASRPAEGRLRYLYVLTDGLIGNDDAMLEAVRSLEADNRVFPVGLGSAPNRALLDRLAASGHGFSRYAAPHEAVDELARDLSDRTARPFLSDLRIDWGGLDARDVDPSPLPDVYEGRPLVITGHFNHPGTGEVTLSGRVGDRAVRTPLRVTFPVDEDRPGVRYLWARRRIADLKRRKGAEAKAEITELGLAHSLVTDYTSFVAVDEQSRVEGPVRRLFQALPLPAGMRWDSVFGGAGGPDESAGPDEPPPPPRSSRRGPRFRAPSLGGGAGDLDPISLTAGGAALWAWYKRRRRKAEGAQDEAAFSPAADDDSAVTDNHSNHHDDDEAPVTSRQEA